VLTSAAVQRLHISPAVKLELVECLPDQLTDEIRLADATARSQVSQPHDIGVWHPGLHEHGLAAAGVQRGLSHV
jgi:hypothetical protein